MRKTILSIMAFCLPMLLIAQGNAKKGETELIPEITYSSQPAQLKGKIVNDQQGRFTDGLRVLCAPSWSEDAIDQMLQVDGQGNFEASLDVLCNSKATLADKEGKTLGSVFVVPGKEVRLTINAKKLQATENMPAPVVQTDEKAAAAAAKAREKAEAKLQAAVHCEGALADLNNGLMNFHDIYTEYRLMAEINGTGIKNLKGLDVSGYKQKIMKIYTDGIARLQKDKRLTPAYREYVTNHYQYICTAMLNGTGTLLRYANQGGEYPLPDGYYDVIKDWNFAASNAFIYTYGGGVKKLGEQTAALWGGTYTLPRSAEQAAKAADCLNRIEGLNPFSPDELQQIARDCPVFFPMISQKNDKMIATIEANKKDNKLNIKEISPDVKGEDIFRTITADYRGKMTLVDFWATWCGPCRKAMETILPVKEQLWGKVNFVYVTGETSPRETWNKMMQAIHGDHFYLTGAQWNDLLNQFGVQGIPAYIVVDKEGNVVNKFIGYPGNEKIMEELSR